MAAEAKTTAEHPLLERADRIRAHLDADEFSKADTEISAAIQEAQSISDLTEVGREAVQAILEAYGEREPGLKSHSVFEGFDHLDLETGLTNVRERMQTLLEGEKEPPPATLEAAEIPPYSVWTLGNAGAVAEGSAPAADSAARQAPASGRKRNERKRRPKKKEDDALREIEGILGKDYNPDDPPAKIIGLINSKVSDQDHWIDNEPTREHIQRANRAKKRQQRAVAGAPAPEARPGARPAPAARPSAGPRPDARLQAIDPVPLRDAIKEATEGKPEDRNRVLQAWQLLQEDAEDCPELRAFQNRIRRIFDTCREVARIQTSGGAMLLSANLDNLLEELKESLAPEKLAAFEQEAEERRLCEVLVSLYHNTPDLQVPIENLMRILAIKPSEADKGAERGHLTQLQTTIRRVLYEEIPTAILPDVKGKSLREKSQLLQGMDFREVDRKSQAVKEKLNSLNGLIDRLSDKFKSRLKRPRPGPRGSEGARSPESAGASGAPGAGGPAARPDGLPGAPAEAAAEAHPPVVPLPPFVIPTEVEGSLLEPLTPPAPRPPERGPARAPRRRRTIDAARVKKLMENVLSDITRYNENSIVGRAVQTLLEKHQANIDMAHLEQFLLHPSNIPTNDEVVTLAREDEYDLRYEAARIESNLNDIREEVSSLLQRQATHRGDAEETRNIRNDLEAKREERDRLVTRKRNVEHALQLKNGNRSYRNAREVLAAIHIYLRQNRIERGPMNFVHIAEAMEKDLEAERQTKRERVWHRGIHLNFMKPTLESTLGNLAKKDPAFEKIGAEKMEQLSQVYDDQNLVKNWVNRLEDQEEVYKTAIPRLIAYLEFALGDAKSTHLNSFSQKRARLLIDHLRRASRDYVMNKVSAEVAGKNEVDKMIAYFKELEQENVDETQIKQELITDHTNLAMAKEILPLLAVGAALPFLGTLAPLVLGASVLGKGVSVAHRGVGKGMPRDWLKSERSRSVVRGLVTTGLVAGVGTLGVVAWPAAVLGGIVGSIPDIYRNWGAIWKGTKKTARVGTAVVKGTARGAKAVNRAVRNRRPKPRHT